MQLKFCFYYWGVKYSIRNGGSRDGAASFL